MSEWFGGSFQLYGVCLLTAARHQENALRLLIDCSSIRLESKDYLSANVTLPSPFKIVGPTINLGKLSSVIPPVQTPGQLSDPFGAVAATYQAPSTSWSQSAKIQDSLSSSLLDAVPRSSSSAL